MVGPLVLNLLDKTELYLEPGKCAYLVQDVFYLALSVRYAFPVRYFFQNWVEVKFSYSHF